MPNLHLPRPSRPAPRLPTADQQQQTPKPSGERRKIQINEYTIERTLGNGSFGKVKLARHQLTGHHVAMKFISKRKMATAEMQDRVQREIQYLSLLQHPHIIKLYEVIPTKDAIVMVIEYLNGELFDYIVNIGRMSEAQARRFFQQIIAAVEYCHSHNIVHRDLKPENLLLDDKLNLKIADFGLSNVMRDGDFLKTSCGSPNYAAPEVISGKLYAGPEIDIWSCGVILYVMLCGRLPFDDEHIPLLFKKINGGIFSLPPYLSPDARNLLQKMLVVDSNKRIKLSEIRKHPWFQKDLPAYLQPIPIRPVDAENEKLEDQNTTEYVEDPNAPIQWVKGVGWVEQSVIDDLCSKIKGLTSDHVWHTLRNNTDKELLIAYQLCRDNRQLPVSEPPPSNPLMNIHPSLMQGLNRPGSKQPTSTTAANTTTAAATTTTTTSAGDDEKASSQQQQQQAQHEPDREAQQQHQPQQSQQQQQQQHFVSTNAYEASTSEMDDAEDDHTKNQIRILETSLVDPGESDEKGLSRNRSINRSLLSGDTPHPMTSQQQQQATTPSSASSTTTSSTTPSVPINTTSTATTTTTTTTSSTTKQASSSLTSRRAPRARWHFGIRSRSPPMEVMLEIYRTLKTLGFEWKKKEAIPEQKELDDRDCDDPKIRKKREEEINKAAQDLFFVATRCRVGDVMVRMDIQLYQIDSENYLVDFRNAGYTPLRRESDASNHTHGTNQSGSATTTTTGVTDDDYYNMESLQSSPSQQQHQQLRNKGVSNPFLFLETSCRLIIELAVGGG